MPFIAVCLLALLSACNRSPELNPVIVVGVDGATWEVIDPLIASGELPNFARLKERGGWARLITVGPQVSPVVWSTLATGRFGRQHGILDFTYPYTPGPKKPVESGHRQSAAIWNIASEAGRSVDVVGYFASYPAEPIGGVMVTDRAFQRIDGSVSPANALDPIKEQLSQYYNGDFQRDLWKRYIHWDHNPEPDPGDPEYEADFMVAGRITSNIVLSEYLRVVTNHLLEQERRDLFITYFRTPDYAAHSLWWYHDDSDYDQKPDPAAQELLGDIIRESYRFIDDVLGDILARAPDNANIIIVSDHGSGSATGEYTIRNEENLKKITGNHRPDGILLAAGPDIKPGELDGLTIMEVFPMMMALLGLPLSDELPANLDYRIFRQGFFEDHPVMSVSAYPHASTITSSVQADEAAQQETVQALRGLGYIDQGFEYGDRESDSNQFWEADSQLLIYHLTGELVYWILREDVPTALSILELARQIRPELAVHLPTRSLAEFNLITARFPPDSLPRASLEEFLAQAAGNANR